MSANDTCDHKHIKQEIGYLGSHEGWEIFEISVPLYASTCSCVSERRALSKMLMVLVACETSSFKLAS